MVKHAVVAPFHGYAVGGLLRASDIIKAGQALAQLDDRELKLGRTRWNSDVEQMQSRYRQAAAQQESTATAGAAAPRPIDEALSSAGGVRFEAMDARLMLRR